MSDLHRAGMRCVRACVACVCMCVCMCVRACVRVLRACVVIYCSLSSGATQVPVCTPDHQSQGKISGEGEEG